MAQLNPISPYETWDQARDKIQRNKDNILQLFEELNNLPFDTDIKSLEKLLGTYEADDAIPALDHNISVIANVVIIKNNLTAALDRIKVNEEAIAVIKSAGIHIPHFATIADLDKAFPNPVDGEVAYVGVNGDWTLVTWAAGVWERGTKSNHSTSGLPVGFVEEEITITPAVYGWKEIKDLWTNDNDNPFGKYEGYKIKIKTDNAVGNVYILEGYNFIGDNVNSFSGVGGSTGDSIVKIKYSNPDVVDTTDETIKTIQIWDIITPAVKATVLVKK